MDEKTILNKPEGKFYEDSAKYWLDVPPTLEGMLGGFGSISQIDIKSSRALLRQLFLNTKNPPDRKQAIDCGAGIGRISKHLLTNFFDKVDLLEQNPVFLEEAKTYLGSSLVSHKIGDFYNESLRNFKFTMKKYDVVWIQWVLGYLTDEDLVKFLKSASEGLKDNGLIIIKENIGSNETEMDYVDSSVTRSMVLFRKLFEEAGLDCWRCVQQTHFPKGLYKVYTFVLRRKNVDNVEKH